MLLSSKVWDPPDLAATHATAAWPSAAAMDEVESSLDSRSSKSVSEQYRTCPPDCGHL